MTQSCHERLVCPNNLDSGAERPDLITLANTRKRTGMKQKEAANYISQQRRNDDDELNSKSLICGTREGSESALSWFIPNNDKSHVSHNFWEQHRQQQQQQQQLETNERSASPGGFSLLEQYQAKKRKERKARMSSAFYIKLEDEEEKEKDEEAPKMKVAPPSPWARRGTGPSSQRTSVNRPRSGKVRTRLIDLEEQQQQQQQRDADDEDHEGSLGDLQEALRRRRPDYIARTRDREADRLARRMVAAQKTACRIVENVPTGEEHYVRPSPSQRRRNNKVPPMQLSEDVRSTHVKMSNVGHSKQKLIHSTIEKRQRPLKGEADKKDKELSKGETNTTGRRTQGLEDRRQKKVIDGNSGRFSSPYGQTLLSSSSSSSSKITAKGMPNIQLRNPSTVAAGKEVRKKKESGLNGKTNKTRTKSIMAGGGSGGISEGKRSSRDNNTN